MVNVHIQGSDLINYTQRLAHFLHTAHVSIVAVAVLPYRDVKLDLENSELAERSSS